MLLEEYKIEIFRPEQNPEFESLHCIAHLEQDISDVLPYLNSLLRWLMAEINTAWERRNEIEPRFEGLPRPGILEVLRWLPRTNCRKCNEPTCLVFATRLAQGIKAAPDCPELSKEARQGLEDYLGRYHLED
jgi:ArsR family metal-binding transcriptional regulator